MNSRIKTIISAMMVVVCIAFVIAAICIAVSPPSKNMQTLLFLMILGAFASAIMIGILSRQKENKNPKILVIIENYDDKIRTMLYELALKGYNVIEHFTTNVKEINELAPNFVITDQFINYDYQEGIATLKIKDGEIKSPTIFILEESIEELITDNMGYIPHPLPINKDGIIGVIEDIIPIAA